MLPLYNPTLNPKTRTLIPKTQVQGRQDESWISWKGSDIVISLRRDDVPVLKRGVRIFRHVLRYVRVGVHIYIHRREGFPSTQLSDLELLAGQAAA